MSFASEMKGELCRIEADEKCSKEELSAIIKMNGSIAISEGKWIINIQTENAAIARRIFRLIKELYKIEPELAVRRKMQLKKNNVYICRVKENTREILDDLNVMRDGEIIHDVELTSLTDDECVRSYLRGAFLAAGSVNNPETSSYHLEIASLYEEHAYSLMKLMNEYELNAKVIDRKRGYITYLKEAEKISDFLGLVGGHQAMLKFEDVRILRDMRNSVNRLVNCETANLNKTISAAMRQVENIKYIDQEIGLEKLPDRLREIAYLRRDNHDMSLKELGESISTGPISKSGVNHRLRKIDEIADKLRSGQDVKL
ncbi:DNA-binding protein WhiA [Nosocomiicoccus sp. HMSC059G07]|uniref:DNA-binding protein WhiA n=1 Tax=Nosocomiicoccus sp. HMSC059G07 TaxID=1739531 RepID=UPI0008A35C8E|nr:DNA-binding protein WhiA [Nosocomiicoccus sp. HMSC059G07]OFO53041.1 sporulation regulator WhiA [Nosocomiicoccus sp. HMSC059G07]